MQLQKTQLKACQGIILNHIALVTNHVEAQGSFQSCHFKEYGNEFNDYLMKNQAGIPRHTRLRQN